MPSPVASHTRDLKPAILSPLPVSPQPSPDGTGRSAVAGWRMSHRESFGPSCLCGTPLAADAQAELWLCAHCGRAFCRDCGGVVTRAGGCDVCTVCGVGACG